MQAKTINQTNMTFIYIFIAMHQVAVLVFLKHQDTKTEWPSFNYLHEMLLHDEMLLFPGIASYCFISLYHYSLSFYV